jgi:ubiquinone/menaquinone biosynthesis C-methylase UbiE
MVRTKTLNNLHELISRYSTGRVLDIATGRGGFVCLLHEHLVGYDTIVGVDYHRHVLLEAYAQCLGPKIAYSQMEVTRLAFAPQSFDMVCASASMHHLENPPSALEEALRTLETGGFFLLVETHRDARDEPQETAVKLHHWAADVDVERGIYHLNTYSRKGLLEFVEHLELADIQSHDIHHPVEDPKDPDTVERLRKFIDRHLALVNGTSAYSGLSERAREIKHRLNTVGVRREPVVAITGVKQSAK